MKVTKFTDLSVNSRTFYAKVFSHGFCCERMQDQIGESISFDTWDGEWGVCIKRPESGDWDLDLVPVLIQYCPFCGERIEMIEAEP